MTARSIGTTASDTPDRPPMTNLAMKPTAKSIAVVMRRRPPIIVAIQLKIFTPVGIAMSMLVAEKIAFSVSPRPTANMWCAHTPKDRKAIATLEPATKA